MRINQLFLKLNSRTKLTEFSGTFHNLKAETVVLKAPT